MLLPSPSSGPMSLAAGVLLVVSFAYAINAIADFRLKPQFADDPDVIK